MSVEEKVVKAVEFFYFVIEILEAVEILIKLTWLKRQLKNKCLKKLKYQVN